MESNHRSELRRIVYSPLYDERKLFGGSGEIRTHGAISDSTVFKTVAINRALPHFRIGTNSWTRTSNTRIFSPLLYHWSYVGIKLAYPEGFEPPLAVLETVVLPLTLKIHNWLRVLDLNQRCSWLMRPE